MNICFKSGCSMASTVSSAMGLGGILRWVLTSNGNKKFKKRAADSNLDSKSNRHEDLSKQRPTWNAKKHHSENRQRDFHNFMNLM